MRGSAPLSENWGNTSPPAPPVSDATEKEAKSALACHWYASYNLTTKYMHSLTIGQYNIRCHLVICDLDGSYGIKVLVGSILYDALCEMYDYMYAIS